MHQRQHDIPTPQGHDPLPFPVERARAIETPTQRLRRIRSEGCRRIDVLAERLGCLGWFDPHHEGPPAA